MKLLRISLNKLLWLDSHKFQNPHNNIESLNALAISSKTLDDKLTWLNLATHKIEKFHSFFHFEQSFFHLQLAIHYLKHNQKELGQEQLELAIFQDHVNKQAIQMLKGSSEYPIYQRPYDNFSDYIEFATDETIDPGRPLPYQYDNIDSIEEIIKDIRYRHLHYHEESAKLYLNRAMVFYQLGEFDLSKNDAIKANNLDNKLKEKDYYLQMEKVDIVLGLGSNLDDRNNYLEQAITKLKEKNILDNITCSTIIESKAALLPNSPDEWDLDFLNMAVRGYTNLTPNELLESIKEIEKELGRKVSAPWSPRIIDIDILIYGDQVIKTDELIIPHPELMERPWALNPLLEIFPDWSGLKDK
jgi:2-amino-4-hydroxy-6-hydroxymethyldihydropteridine diphosphokinase